MTYSVYYVNKSLSIAPQETINDLSRLPVREDCLDEGGEFIVGNGVADQALPCLLMEADSNGWVRRVVRMPCKIKRT